LKNSALQVKKSTTKVETLRYCLRIERAKTISDLKKFRFLIEKVKAKALLFI